MAQSPQDPFADGLSYEDALPLVWRVMPAPPDDRRLHGLNRDNETVLRMVAALDEFRPELNEESGAGASELSHIDFKLNVLLDLVSQLLTREQHLPEPVPVRVSARGLEWMSRDPVTGGELLLLSVYLQPSYPRPLQLPARLLSAAQEAAGTRVRVAFHGLSEGVEDALERLIFRNHRRQIAQSRVPRATD